MSKYKYKAMDSNGREVSGRVVAESEAEACSTVKEMGFFPISVKYCEADAKDEVPNIRFVLSERAKNMLVSSIAGAIFGVVMYIIINQMIGK